MYLRPRDQNVENAGQQAAAKRQVLHPIKHKANIDNKVGGEPKAKRAALGDITKALSSYQIDSTKKKPAPQPLGVNKEKEQRLASLQEQLGAEDLEVDPVPEFDFDKENAHDPYAVSEFAQDIMKYYKWREPLFVPDNFFAHHRSLDPKDRATLVDWMIEVQEAFEMNHETLYMAINMIDRFLSNARRVRRDNLQLIACAAALIAAKVEERSAPLIDDLAFLCRDAFDGRRLKRMEQELLMTVGFDLCAPLSYSFLRRYGRVIKADMSILTTARYVLEVSLHFLDFCRLSPSRLAAASMLLALQMTKSGDWYSGYTVEDLEAVMWSLNHMLHQYKNVFPHVIKVYEKYEHEVFFRVAKIPALPDRFSAAEPIAPPANVLALDLSQMQERLQKMGGDQA